MASSVPRSLKRSQHKGVRRKRVARLRGRPPARLTLTKRGCNLRRFRRPCSAGIGTNSEKRWRRSNYCWPNHQRRLADQIDDMAGFNWRRSYCPIVLTESSRRQSSVCRIASRCPFFFEFAHVRRALCRTVGQVPFSRLRGRRWRSWHTQRRRDDQEYEGRRTGLDEHCDHLFHGRGQRLPISIRAR